MGLKNLLRAFRASQANLAARDSGKVSAFGTTAAFEAGLACNADGLSLPRLSSAEFRKGYAFGEQLGRNAEARRAKERGE